jgi:hypothetical protein
MTEAISDSLDKVNHLVDRLTDLARHSTAIAAGEPFTVHVEIAGSYVQLAGLGAETISAGLSGTREGIKSLAIQAVADLSAQVQALA